MLCTFIIHRSISAAAGVPKGDIPGIMIEFVHSSARRIAVNQRVVGGGPRPPKSNPPNIMGHPMNPAATSTESLNDDSDVGGRQ